MSREFVPLPCPFCGKTPVVGPHDNDTKSGTAFAYVECVNDRCSAKPRVDDGALQCDERGRAAYKKLAVRRWNRRYL